MKTQQVLKTAFLITIIVTPCFAAANSEVQTSDRLPLVSQHPVTVYDQDAETHEYNSDHELFDSFREKVFVDFVAQFVFERERQNLKTFDDLDFIVFTHQKWHELENSHAQDVIVHWPDGHITTGIDVHIEDLKALFVFAPDTRIQEHPIRIAEGKMTAVTGVMEGTFTQPMPLADGHSRTLGKRCYD